MPARYQLFSTHLTAYRPVLWLAQPVHSRYGQLRGLLQNRFGTGPDAGHYGQLLAEPQIPPTTDQARVEGRWFTDAFRSGTPLSALPADERARVSQLLEGRLTAIRQFADELEREPAGETRQLATLLRLAIEVPGPEFVLVNGDQIVLVLWGFDSDRSRQDRFRISQYLSHQATTAPAPVPLNPAEIGAVPPGLSTENTKSGRRWWAFWTWRLGASRSAGWGLRRNTILTSGPGSGFGCWGFLLGLCLLALLGALLYGFWPSRWGHVAWVPGPAPVSPYLPDRPRIIPPLDSTQIITNPTDSLRRPIVGNKLNVFLKKDTNLSAFVDTLKQKYPATDWQVVSYDTVYKALQIQFPMDQRETWRQRLQTMQAVYVVFDEQLFTTRARPSDPDFADIQKSWYFGAIRAYQAWDITRGSSAVTVAVLDGGFDTDHPELANLFVHPRNTVDNQPVVSAGGAVGGRHGTHAAGPVAGQAENGSGSSGIAPNCRVMPVQVGTDAVSSLALVYGIQYAIQNGVQVISLSLGSAVPPALLTRLRTLPDDERDRWLQAFRNSAPYEAENVLFTKLFGEANRNNIVVVKATGNDGLPAGFDPMNANPYTINVAAVGPVAVNGPVALANFSNYGTLATVAAPGVRIYNAVPGGGYDYLDGTSMATPIVAGSVALMRSLRPDLTPVQIRTILVETGLPLTPAERPAGPLIQLDKALLACRNQPGDPCARLTDSLRRELSKVRSPLPAS